MHVFEERTRENLDVGDLHRGQMDAPTRNNFSHLAYDLFTEQLAVLDDVVDGRVCDLVADDGARHISKSIVRCFVVSTREVEVLESFEWRVSVDSPFDHCGYLKSLHLLGHLLGPDFDLDVLGWEDGDLFIVSLEAAETNS